MARRSVLRMLFALDQGARDSVVLHLIQDYVENYGTSPGSVPVMWQGQRTTLFERAAQLGERRIVEELLNLGGDPNNIRDAAPAVQDLIYS